MDNLIRSKQNSYIKFTKSLHQKKYRDEHQKYLVEGIRAAEEVIESENSFDFGLYTAKVVEHPRGANLLAQLKNTKRPLFQVEESILKEVSDTENPQGLILVMNKQNYQLAQLSPHKNSMLLIVDGIQDPGNLGTIIRTACAAGADGVVLLKGTVDFYSPKVIRSTMGALFKIPVVIGLTAEETLAFLKDKGFRILVADIKGEQVYSEASVEGPLAWVLGNEAAGPSALWKENADTLVSIPLWGPIESLNVAVAAGILMYETCRRRS